MPIPVTLPMILDAHTEGVLQDVHTAIPGTIVSWDSASQTATVQPAVRKPLRSADGVQVYETPPQIQGVPCYVQRGGGFLVSVPYMIGDPVWLMFSEQSYAEYMSTGQISNPRDIRRHGIGYPFAMPGPAPQALQSVSSSNLVVGLDGHDQQIEISGTQIKLGRAATSLVALASLVNSELSKIQLSLESIAGNLGAGGSTVTGPNTYTAGNVSASITLAQ